MVQEVYPAIRDADAVVLLCPNYNDALSANLTAAINRLTALYRTTSFAEKAVFAIVVSGYSGGDIVASQVVSALNMNKGFWLPGGFCLLETANNKGEAERLPGIEERLERVRRNDSATTDHMIWKRTHGVAVRPFFAPQTAAAIPSLIRRRQNFPDGW